MLNFTVILLYENNQCSLPHIMRMIGSLMSFPKIYDLRETNVGIDFFLV